MHQTGRILAVAADAVHVRCFGARRQGGRLIEHDGWLDALTVTAVPGSASGGIHDRMGEALHGTAPRPAAEQIGILYRPRRFGDLVLFATRPAVGRLREQPDTAIRDPRFHAA